jgi:hypothetical protein
MFQTVKQVTRTSVRPLVAQTSGGEVIVPPADPLLQTEPRIFNRRLAVTSLGAPILDGNLDQVWYNQINSLYYSHPLVTVGSITSLGYFTVYDLSTAEEVRGETWAQPFTPVVLATFDAPYATGGIAWNGLLRIDVPKPAFAGKPQKIIVVLNGDELPEYTIPWEVVI